MNKDCCSIRLPLAVALILYVALLAVIVLTAPMLPERVASHFGTAGTPNGWMSKSGFLTFTALFGLGLPVVITMLFWSIPRFPRWMVNLPDKDYWLGPEQRDMTRWWLVRYGLWLSCAMLLLFGATHWQVVQANRSNPVRLDNSGFFVVLAFFLVAVAILTFRLLRRFSRKNRQN